MVKSEGLCIVTERQQLILLADKSEFGWKTVEEYTQHELADDWAVGQKICRAEEKAKKALKSTTAKRSVKTSALLCHPSSCHVVSQDYRASLLNQGEWLPSARSVSFPDRPCSYFAFGKFGHWRSECPHTQSAAVNKGISGN